MKKFVRNILFSAFLTVVGFGTVHAEDIDNELDFQGRIRAWYQSSSEKANSDADSISDSKFQASSRIGVSGKTVKGDWTAKVKLEVEAHEEKTPGVVSTTTRDASVTVGNKSFDLKLGRQWMPDFGGNNTYSAMNSAEATVGELGRTEGAVLTLKSIPKATLQLVYFDVVSTGKVNTLVNGENKEIDKSYDITAYAPVISYEVNDKLTVSASYASHSKVENEDKSEAGNSDNSENKSGFAVFGIMDLGKAAPYIGYDSYDITKSAAGADDEDSSITHLLAGVDVGLGDDMGVHAEYFATTETPDEGDDVVTTNLSLAFEKTIANTEVQVGYNTESVSAGDDEAQDGAVANSIVAGVRYNF